MHIYIHVHLKYMYIYIRLHKGRCGCTGWGYCKVVSVGFRVGVTYLWLVGRKGGIAEIVTVILQHQKRQKVPTKHGPSNVVACSRPSVIMG